MNRKNKVWMAIGGIILAGVMFSIWDYINYLKIESQNYGHGPGEKIVSWKLTQVYQNEQDKVRIKYPDSMIQISNNPVEFKDSEVKVSLRIRNEKKTLADLENEEIARLSANEQLFGERQYENTERINMTVINLQRFETDKTWMISRYLAKRYDRLYILEFVTDLANWTKNEGNFREMARSMVLF